jgi:hypothetical protein
MPGLSEQKIEIVRTLVEGSPDRIVGALQGALSGAAGDAALDEVRRVVNAEAQDRRLRNLALQPVAALFAGDGRSAAQLTFPIRALALIWRGLKAEARAQVDEVAAAYDDYASEETPTEALNALARIAAEGLRSGAARDFVAAAALCDAARPGGAALLAACLDLSAIVRGATHKLGDWITRTSEANTAAARLAYKDAVDVAEDAGCRFFEMLAGQLAQPWMIMRIISAVMDKPTEKYLAESELASFAQRLLDDIDRNLTIVSRLNVDGGPAAGIAAARAVETITLQISEMEETIALVREGPWGARIAKQKQTLAAAVEDRLRAADKAAHAALPTQPAKILKLLKQVPRLADPPDSMATLRATTLLTFAYETRSSASYGGFASARAKLVEKLGEMTDHYVEEVLDRLRTGEVEDPAIARQFLAVAADLRAVIGDDKGAELIRRRSATSAHIEPVAPQMIG